MVLFHADPAALENYYGAGFRKNALKPNARVEEILKSDIEKGLSRATKDTRKGDYFDNKTSHGPELLSRINVGKVRNAAPNCNRLFDIVLARFTGIHR